MRNNAKSGAVRAHFLLMTRWSRWCGDRACFCPTQALVAAVWRRCRSQTLAETTVSSDQNRGGLFITEECPSTNQSRSAGRHALRLSRGENLVSICMYVCCECTPIYTHSHLHRWWCGLRTRICASQILMVRGLMIHSNSH